ncbi:unnamed protein product [Cercospora beticola]|nr:unnamed protein product [Cercospora beticola]
MMLKCTDIASWWGADAFGGKIPDKVREANNKNGVQQSEANGGYRTRWTTLLSDSTHFQKLRNDADEDSEPTLSPKDSISRRLFRGICDVVHIVRQQNYALGPEWPIFAVHNEAHRYLLDLALQDDWWAMLPKTEVLKIFSAYGRKIDAAALAKLKQDIENAREVPEASDNETAERVDVGTPKQWVFRVFAKTFASMKQADDSLPSIGNLFTA